MKSVASADGTLIAYEQAGSGPNLVFVHGNLASRTRWASIRPRFEKHFTVIGVDRRGRGDSGDSSDYSIEREFEDIAAVVNVLDKPVLLFGRPPADMHLLPEAPVAVFVPRQRGHATPVKT